MMFESYAGGVAVGVGVRVQVALKPIEYIMDIIEIVSYQYSYHPSMFESSVSQQIPHDSTTNSCGRPQRTGS